MSQVAARRMDVLSVNGVQDPTRLDATTRSLIERRGEVFGPGYRLQYGRPVRPVRAHGTKIYDASGEVLLDAYNNVPCIGHGNPRVVEAMTEQLAMVSTNTRYLQDKVLQYAERLLATFEPSLDRVMFACTGSEANDLAIRVARHVTGHTGIIASEFAYHGTTSLVASFSPSGGFRIPLGQDVRLVAPPDPRRTPGEDVALFFASQVRGAIEDLHRHGVGVAAMILDGLFSSDGIYPASRSILQPAIDLVRGAGGLIILDEVQSGFGRTGNHLWGHQTFGVTPDIVTLGKPMANGLPVAAVVAEWDLIEDFGSQIPYFNTFAGNTGCIAAADAVLGVLQTDGVLDNVRRQSAALVEGMRSATSRVASRFEIRSSGLYIGVGIFGEDGQTEDPALADWIVNEMRELGVLISLAGATGSVLKVRPPLVFDDADTDRFLSTFAQVVQSAAL